MYLQMIWKLNSEIWNDGSLEIFLKKHYQITNKGIFILELINLINKLNNFC